MIESRSETQYQVAASVKKIGDDRLAGLVPVGRDRVDELGAGRELVEVLLEPDRARLRGLLTPDAAGSLAERVPDLVQRRRHRDPERAPRTTPPTTRRWRRIATDCGTRWRPSQSTPGRIAAANVSARSRRMRTLRTCQIPNGERDDRERGRGCLGDAEGEVAVGGRHHGLRLSRPRRRAASGGALRNDAPRVEQRQR